MSVFPKRCNRKKRMFERTDITIVEVITIIAIVIVIGLVLLPSILKVCNKQETVVTVTDKGVKRKGSSDDKYLIYTDVTTYEITDSLLKWRWNSSDLYGSIQVGKTYKIETGGYRIDILSMYQNIYKATEVE